MEQLASSDRTSVSDVSSSATVEPSSAKEMWQSGPAKAGGKRLDRERLA